MVIPEETVPITGTVIVPNHFVPIQIVLESTSRGTVLFVHRDSDGMVLDIMESDNGHSFSIVVGDKEMFGGTVFILTLSPRDDTAIRFNVHGDVGFNKVSRRSI